MIDANVIIAFVALIFLLIFTILLVQFTMRYIYNYQIRDTAIEIVLFGKIPIRRIPYNNIAEIRKLPFKVVLPLSIEMFSALSFGNRVWGTGVLVRKKKGMIKQILITPDNPDRFIFETLQHLPKEADDGTVSDE